MLPLCLQVNGNKISYTIKFTYGRLTSAVQVPTLYSLVMTCLVSLTLILIFCHCL